MKLLVFTVPGAPVPYQRPAQSAVGKPFADPKTGAMMTRVHRYTDAKTAAYMLFVGSAASRAVWALGSGWPKPKLVGGELRGPDGAFELTVHFFRRAHRGDLDNLVKSVADALTKAAVWRDDSRMVSLVASMGVDALNPRTMVSVKMKAD